MTSSVPTPGNSLAEKATSTLLAQWHPRKNGDVTPADVNAGSSKKAWWQCDRGHEWESAVGNRVKGTGCPYCAGKRAIAGVNDLQTLHPLITMQWDRNKNTLDPSFLLPSSNKKAWWVCTEGHEWEAVIASRSKGIGCPYCSGHKTTTGVNDLGTLRPDKAAQWDDERNKKLTPSDIGIGSRQKVWWKGCTVNSAHRWQTAVHSQVSARGDGCAVCAGRQVMTTFGVQSSPGEYLSMPDLLSADQNVFNTCIGEDKTTVLTDSVEENPLLIREEDVISGMPSMVVTKTASKTLMSQGSTELLSQWHPILNGNLTPTDVTSVSGRYVWWQCSLGHEWRAKVSNRFNGSGCPFCSNSKVLVGFNDLSTTHPDIAAQWHPTKNTKPLSTLQKGASGTYWWQCEHGHEWEARLSSRVYGKTKCPYCTGRKAIRGVNDLSTTHPLLAKEWDEDKNPSIEEFTAHSSHKVWWVCAKNDSHTWCTRPWDRAIKSNPTGCPLCFCENTTSKGEDALATWLHSSGIKIQRHSRSIINPYEIDIYLPDYNMGIEFNGLYWHSESAGKDKSYHKNKMLQCASKNVILFQVWEDDWRDKQEVVKNMILHRLGLSLQPRVYARQTYVDSVDIPTAKKFLENNHIQGYAFSGNYFGLYDTSDALVALMLIKKSSHGDIYLDRYATSKVVIGGFTKLLKYAVKTLKPKRVITFADQSISQGNLYENNGFVIDKILEPDYMYLVRGKREHKFNYRKARFAKDPDLLFDPTMTETELARENKLHRIWDSGKIRYVYTPGK